MKILCICPIGIGNYLLCYPAWKALQAIRPDDELHLLALRKSITDIACADDLWRKIHCIDPTKTRSPKTITAFFAGLRNEHYATSLCFFPSNKWQYNLLPFCAGIKKRYAFRYDLRRTVSLSMLNTDLVPVDHRLHDVEQNIRLTARFTGRDLSSAETVFPELSTPADRKRAVSLLPGNHPAFIAIHPGSSTDNGMDAKRWPPERFAALADRICEKIKAAALIVGGPEEKALKKQTAAAMKKTSYLIAPQTLAVTAALLRKCTLCLCNDSGIMHLAAAGGISTIALFGPTDERRNGPYGDIHCIIRKTMDGFPLWTAANVGKRIVPHGIDPRESLLALSVDEAWDQCETFLEQFVTG